MTEKRHKILVIDDEPLIRQSLELLLKGTFDVKVAKDGEEGIELFKTLSPDIVLLDLMMPGIDGIETLKRIRATAKDTPVVMLTAMNTAKTAVQALKLGASDYINKPFDFHELSNCLLKLLDKTSKSAFEAESKSVHSKKTAGSRKIVGECDEIKRILSQIEKISKRDTTVLISGESGTGKELVAREIHDNSLRSDKAFIAINCAAIPESLIESELFGHEKGSFTGANEQRAGQFEAANKGTLFLDEIGELNLQMQVKLLRVLQEQEFYRVGGNKLVKVDVRIVTATNKDLEKMVKEKRFREDLYYRLNVINFKLPALRERKGDFECLFEYFNQKFSEKFKFSKLKFSSDGLNKLTSYSWPGNIRELENVLEGLYALCGENGEVLVEDLPSRIIADNSIEHTNTGTFSKNLNYEEAERAFEMDIILKALKKSNFVQTRAADMLGISRRILKYKMDKLGIPGGGEIEQ